LLSAWQSNSLATAANDQVTALFGRFALSSAGYFGIIGIVVLIAGMTAFTTRLTVVRTIREIDRQRADPFTGRNWLNRPESAANPAGPCPILGVWP
jgi:cell division transport system permease protein